MGVLNSALRGSLIGINLVLLCLLAACTGNEPESRLQNYQERLGRSVLYEGEELSEHYETSADSMSLALALLRKESLARLEAKQTFEDMGILEFLSLYGCDLQVIVAERNSGMGKLAPASQRFLYELSFQRAIPACLTTLDREEGSELKDKILLLAQQKQALLPELLWQTLMLEKEARAFWKPQTHLNDYPRDVGLDVVLTLNSMRQWVENFLQWQSRSQQTLRFDVPDLPSEQLETWLFELSKGDGGRLYQSLHVYRHGLMAANAMLDAAYPAWCARVQTSDQKRILENVIAKFFVADVQVWASELSQRYYALMEPYRALEQAFEQVESRAYSAWRESRDLEMERAFITSREHVGALNRFRDACQSP